MVANIARASEVVVQGYWVTRKSVERVLKETGDVPPLRNASFYVLRADGNPIGAKEVIYAVTGGVGHWGNQAAQALLKLGYMVRVRRRADVHGKPPYAKFAEAGLLVFDDEQQTPVSPPATDDNDFDPAAFFDTREKALRGLYLRTGQPAFRAAVMAAYNSTCAVTGCTTVDVLEAAHIYPYRGPETNRVTNGLVLRSDIHLLFDSGLLTISETDYGIILSKRLRDTDYAELHGEVLLVPNQEAQWPNCAALRAHRMSAGIHLPRKSTRKRGDEA
jgi:hypothetical protein